MNKETSMVLYSSKKHDWETPRWVVDLCEIRLNADFDLDAAASEKNTVAPMFLTKEQDGLSVDWVESIVSRSPKRGGCLLFNPSKNRHKVLAQLVFPSVRVVVY